MYKLLSLIFLLLVILVGSAKSMDLAVYQNGFYLRYEFPRFSDQSWFELEFGSRRGIAGLVKDLQARAEN